MVELLIWAIPTAITVVTFLAYMINEGDGPKDDPAYWAKRRAYWQEHDPHRVFSHIMSERKQMGLPLTPRSD